jgi:hypothetical protein
VGDHSESSVSALRARHGVLLTAQVVLRGHAHERGHERDALLGEAKAPRHRVEDHERVAHGHDADRGGEQDDEEQPGNREHEPAREPGRGPGVDGAPARIVHAQTAAPGDLADAEDHHPDEDEHEKRRCHRKLPVV